MLQEHKSVSHLYCMKKKNCVVCEGLEKITDWIHWNALSFPFTVIQPYRAIKAWSMDLLEQGEKLLYLMENMSISAIRLRFWWVLIFIYLFIFWFSDGRKFLGCWCLFNERLVYEFVTGVHHVRKTLQKLSRFTMKIKNLAHKLHVNLLRTRDICHGQRRIDTDQFKLNDNCQKVDLYLEIIG